LVKLFIDILRLNSMMTDMNGFRKTKAEKVAATMDHAYLGLSGRQGPNQEVYVMKVLATGVVAVLVMVLVVGAALAVEGLLGWSEIAEGGQSPALGAPQSGTVPAISDMSRAQGMMPEVVVTADMPRLVMPTVEVQAVRAVAMSGSDLRVN
jgi:hypothetical protein